LNDDIAAIVAGRSAIGAATAQQQRAPGAQPQPAGSSAALDGFGSVFTSSLRSTMATVYERGAAGEFDDRTLVLEEQAALQRLRLAQQAAAAARPVGTDGVPVADGEPDGANAAPDAQGTPAVDGGGPAPAANVAVAEQRELHAVRIRASEARLAKISAELPREYPLAALLETASAGTWDPETFVPQTREQAEAFAQRIVIDVTQSAARLEILKNQLDSARFELAQGGASAQLQQQVVELEAAYERQKSYVHKLARVADRQSGGMVTDAGDDVAAGRTMRGLADIGSEELAESLRAEGLSEAQVRLLLGATEVAVEQEKSPEGSQRLKAMASEMTRTLVAQFNRRVQEHTEERARQEERRAEERRDDDKRAERRRAEEKSVDERVEDRRAQQQASLQAQELRAAQRDAEFRQWVEQLAARSQQRDAG
jgi:predicted transcriptional regulator